MNLQAWISAVNKHVSSRLGLTTRDMPDCPFSDWFEDGLTPEQGADEAMQYWVDSGDLPEELL